MKKLSLADLAAMEGDCLTAEDVAYVMKSDPNTVRGMAREFPELLGFPVTCLGRRVIIPKIPFLRHFGVQVESAIGGGVGA